MDVRIKCFIHNSVRATIDDDFVKFHQYFMAHGVNTICEIIHTDVTKDMALVQLMQPNAGKCDVVMYLYDRGAFQAQSNGLTFRVTPNLVGIYLATSVADDNVDYTWKSMCHELMHALFIKLTNNNGNIPMDLMIVNGSPMPYYKNELLDAPDGNFAEAWKILTPKLKASPYKYFSQAEVDKWKLKPELFAILDKAREIAGVPFKITSGLRSVQQNEDAGGTQDSSHLKGLGCDLSVIDSEKRYKIVSALLKVGFTRIGIYLEHLHCDISLELPQEVMWYKITK